MDTWDSGRVRTNSRRPLTCFSQSPSLPQQVRQTHKSFSSCDTSSFGDQTTSTCEKTGKREEDARRPQKKSAIIEAEKGRGCMGSPWLRGLRAAAAPGGRERAQKLPADDLTGETER